MINYTPSLPQSYAALTLKSKTIVYTPMKPLEAFRYMHAQDAFISNITNAQQGLDEVVSESIALSSTGGITCPM